MAKHDRVRSYVASAFLASAIASTLITAAPARFSQSSPQDFTLLERFKPIERELTGGMAHHYQVRVAAGEFLHVDVEERRIDVVVTLLGSEGKQLLQVDDSGGTSNHETLLWVADQTEDYRIEVRSSSKTATAGRYEVQIAELRPATDNDRRLVEALNLYVESLNLLEKGAYKEAIAPAARALAIRETILGSDHLDVVPALNNLGEIYYNAGNLSEAESLFRRAIAIQEKGSGPELGLATLLNNLAALVQQQANDVEAETMHLRALAIWQRQLGPEDPLVGYSLNNLGMVYWRRADYAKAADFLERALAVREKALGTEHLDVANTLNNLGLLNSDKGDYVKAETYYQLVLSIREKLRGPEHPDVARVLNNIAILRSMMGDYVTAIKLQERNLAIWEKSAGPEHPQVAVVLSNLASIYEKQREYPKAESMVQRSLAILEKTVGPNNPEFVETLVKLAILARKQGEYSRAELLFQRAVSLGEQVLGTEHPRFALSLQGLALLYQEKGEYEKAEPLFKRALTILEGALGSDHPDVGVLWANVAEFYRLKGDLPKALEFLQQSSEIREHNLRQNLWIGSERQKLRYLGLFEREASNAISLQSQEPANPEVLRLALTTVLRLKGRGLDAMTDTISVLRRSGVAKDQAALNELAVARAQFAALTFKEPDRSDLATYRSQRERLAERVEQLESAISTQGVAYREQSLPTTIDAVQSAIPEEAKLVEFVLYVPRERKVADNPASRYSAYVLARSGQPQWIDLGESSTIDEGVAKFRQALRSPSRTDVKFLARALDEKLMRPIRQRLGDAREVILSPDGALNLVPFGALVDERDQYLVERYSFRYVTSGRDLLRLQAHPPSKQGPVVVAGPQFDWVEKEAPQRGAPPKEVRRSFDFIQANFTPLPGAVIEGKAVATALGGAKVWIGAQATEAAVKQISGPSVLHIATHGFFLEDQKRSIINAAGREDYESVFAENPLLRSGLILAGANRRESGAGEDGILTASEVASLDLTGTTLVVLSACDTGLGQVKNGDGVYGLRRALVLAGAESQVITLWEVADRATRELMVSYYGELSRGEGRGEALRRVQLRMLRTSNRRHPYFWAGFVQSGEWRKL